MYTFYWSQIILKEREEKKKARETGESGEIGETDDKDDEICQDEENRCVVEYAAKFCLHSCFLNQF